MRPTPDPRRRFNSSERAALYLAADGHCTDCGSELEPGWHADHRTPHSRGGATDVINGQALCPTCNLQKGAAPVSNLRLWQESATNKFFAANKKDFLVCATPGAGKTRFALMLAKRLLSEGTIRRVAVVVPTDALRQQWADAAGLAGISLMPVNDTADYAKPGYQGCVVTYAQIARGVGSDMLRHATRVPTLAIMDEVHHAGDNRSWGDGLKNAVEHAVHRLALTGTPWRADSNSPIPFVAYNENGTVQVDYAYEYGEAVADGVCRRIEFHAYDGEARWIDCGKVETAALGADLLEEDVSAALDVVYHPEKEWMPVLLRKAAEALDEVRQDIPDAAGLIVADRKWHAHAYAKLLEDITGRRPVVVVSDDPEAKAAIDRFRGTSEPWIIAVRMVSEGVDIPRLAVGVYAAKIRTPLFFRQVVGRFVRVRPDEEFNARLFIPAVNVLMNHAREIEQELRHQLEADRAKEEKARADAGEGASQGVLDFREPLSASEAIFDRAILGGREAEAVKVEAAQAECRKLGIPTQFAMNLVPLLDRMQEAASAGVAAAAGNPRIEEPRHRRERVLRGEIDSLVGKISYRTGKDKREINTELLRRGYPARKHASVEQLEEIRDELARWLGL
ncbi:DEAD/DEAH box helicase family protein [Micromonospora sp. NPDC047670]|uniref:DEAD/DEAH box helicase family protein n=1 Tax=Micromonospora sp. NPDC047670 TaxID=3364252 RepID=UPI003712C71E